MNKVIASIGAISLSTSIALAGVVLEAQASGAGSGNSGRSENTEPPTPGGKLVNQPH